MRVLAGDLVTDRDDRAPLREAGAEPVVGLEPFAEAVEALGHGLAGRVRERLRALVDLDAGDDPLLCEQLRERRAVERLLADRLVEEDHAADEVLRARSREQEVAVGAPVVLGRIDPDRVEALLDRAVALVRGQDSLARRDELACDVVELAHC